jgi:hypothetical protein
MPLGVRGVLGLLAGRQCALGSGQGGVVRSTALATIYRRGEAFFIALSDQTTVGFWVGPGSVERVDGVDAEAIGSGLMRQLDRSKSAFVIDGRTSGEHKDGTGRLWRPMAAVPASVGMADGGSVRPMSTAGGTDGSRRP